MRPLRLVMRAFGPFPEEETIDFRALAEQSFFLIHGETGAGKSTILDAICVALYGDDPSLLRKGSSFRSSYARPQCETEVVFDFALGDERYRVHRIPAQERAKRRGTGTTRIPASATLWNRSKCTTDEEEGEPIATQPSNVTERIEELIGFKCSQFRQVVVLPQGEFYKLLRASSSEREQIMEHLFDVQVYAQIQDALKQEAAHVEAIGREQHVRLDEILHESGVSHAEELTTKLEQVAERHKAACVRLRLAKQGEERARKALETGRAAEAVLTELGNSESEWIKLQERSAEFANFRQTFEQARQALPLRTEEEHLRQRTDEAAQAEAYAIGQREKCENADAAALQAKARLAAEEKRDAERQTALREALRLETLREKLEYFRETDHKLATSAQRVKTAREQFEATMREWKGTQSQLLAAREQRSAAAERAATLPAVRQTQQALRAQLEAYESREQIRIKLDSLAEQHRHIETTVREQLQKLGAAREEERQAQRAREAAQASLLAVELQDGAPCPVCGSTTHPKLATSDEHVPDNASLAQLRTQLDQLEMELSTTREQKGDLETQIAALEGQCNALRHSEDEHATSDIAALRIQLADAEVDARRAAEAGETCRVLDAHITSLQQRDAVGEAAQSEAARELAARESEHNQIVGLHTEQAASIPEELRSPEAAEVAIKTAQDRRDLLEAAYRLAQENLARCEQTRAQAHTTRKEAAAAFQRLNELLREQLARFSQSLEDRGFPNRDAIRAAMRSETEIAELEGRIQDYDAQCGAAKTRCARAKSQTEGLSPPALEELALTLEQATAAREQTHAEVVSLQKDFERYTALSQRFADENQKLEDLRTRYKSLGHIAKVANGDNRQKLTFQRFVLAAFLDDVLDLASVTLRKLSKGRYQLRRADESIDRRTTGGLDLMVFDAYTGTERSVATLSGGESFLASLALALGLAEVVQHYAGGIRLDAIFIDEGFGTLDADALDLAIATLLELRQGKRMVGVISHVAELRERIDTRLEIVKGSHGSRTHFVLP